MMSQMRARSARLSPTLPCTVVPSSEGLVMDSRLSVYPPINILFFLIDWVRRSVWEGQLSLPLSNLIRHLTLRIIYSGFTMKPARQESNSVLSTMLYRNGHWPLVPSYCHPKSDPDKRHNHFWPEGQDTEASVSGQNSNVSRCFSLKCSQDNSADTDALPGALQHPWLWRQVWLLWALTRAASFLSWVLS